MNVGGQKFITSLTTLQKEPDSMLGIMFSGRHKIIKQEDGSVFIDRDGTHFGIILNFLRGNIKSLDQLPDDKLTLSDISVEAEFYQLTKLIEIINQGKKRVIGQKEIDERKWRESDCFMHQLTEKIVFRNSLIINLKFKMIHFSHSIDFSDSVLIDTRFYDCFFYNCCQYSFDRADLCNCFFQECYGVDYDDDEDADTDDEIVDFQNKQQ